MMSAINTAIPTLVFSAISDAAITQPETNKIKTKNIRMYHPWSSLTDEGLNDDDSCNGMSSTTVTSRDIAHGDYLACVIGSSFPAFSLTAMRRVPLYQLVSHLD